MIDPHDLSVRLNAEGRGLEMSVVAEGWGGDVLLKSDRPGQVLEVIFSSHAGWDHVSACVCMPGRIVRVPSYSEMRRIKRLFFKPDEVAMELHVAEADHINTNPYTLHLWRPHDQAIPLPPKELV